MAKRKTQEQKVSALEKKFVKQGEELARHTMWLNQEVNSTRKLSGFSPMRNPIGITHKPVIAASTFSMLSIEPKEVVPYVKKGGTFALGALRDAGVISAASAAKPAAKPAASTSEPAAQSASSRFSSRWAKRRRYRAKGRIRAVEADTKAPQPESD